MVSKGCLKPDPRRKWKKAYRRVYEDAEKMLHDYSLWFVCCFRFYSGLQPKTDKSNLQLFRYCKGFNAAMEREAKDKGVEIQKHGFIKQEDIIK